jgi:UDP-N-acetyl-D-mannosaminuronic acid transferase (WecB/TagA/CpsF family)
MLETVMNINKLKAMKLNKRKLVYMNEEKEKEEIGIGIGGTFDIETGI